MANFFFKSAIGTFGEAFGTDCEKTQNWAVGNYLVQEYECIGYVGPQFYPIDLFRNGERIDEYIFKVDSCTLNSQPKKDLFLKIDICNQKITELRPMKKVFKKDEVDSVQLYSKKLNTKKTLTRIKMNELLKDWNKSEVREYREKHLDSIFHPDYQYKIVIFSNSDSLEFRTFNHLISDSSKWVYEIKKYPDTTYFKKLWN